MGIQVAIDGPAGAGKSTISKYVATSLNFFHIDTGSMYRAFAWYIVNSKIEDDVNKIISMLDSFNLDIENENMEVKLIVNNTDITNRIRTNEISMMASKIATIKEVREKMVKIQRDIASDKSVVMDGRDIGTHVLPNADIKIFLTASVDDRALRRYKELKEKGIDVNLESIKEDIINRDHNDSNRKISPLKKANDAKLIDTSGNSLEKSKRVILDYVKNQVKEIQKTRI